MSDSRLPVGLLEQGDETLGSSSNVQHLGDSAVPLDLWGAGAISVEGAASFLSVSRRTIYELMADGLLPSKKLRGRRLISRTALGALLAGLKE